MQVQGSMLLCLPDGQGRIINIFGSGSSADCNCLGSTMIQNWGGFVDAVFFRTTIFGRHPPSKKPRRLLPVLVVEYSEPLAAAGTHAPLVCQQTKPRQWASAAKINGETKRNSGLLLGWSQCLQGLVLVVRFGPGIVGCSTLELVPSASGRVP